MKLGQHKEMTTKKPFFRQKRCEFSENFVLLQPSCVIPRLFRGSININLRTKARPESSKQNENESIKIRRNIRGFREEHSER